jgi:hypothetical protein
VPDIVATYAVHAGTTAELSIDTAGMDPDTIACYLTEDASVDAGPLCHECADKVIDPEIAHLVAFTVDGVTYEQDEDTGHWVAATGRPGGRARPVGAA